MKQEGETLIRLQDSIFSQNECSDFNKNLWLCPFVENELISLWLIQVLFGQ